MNISVLMSVYFKESPVFLKEAIDSILQQTVKADEIVCIKDGKLTKELDSLLDKYDEENPGLFKFIVFEENKGLGNALRNGVEACSNEIIARMDTDDIALPTRFEKQFTRMKENDLDIVGSNILEFDGSVDNILSERKVPSTYEMIKAYAKKRNPFNHMTVMYKKSAVLKAGNYKDFLWFEDYNLWVRMILNGAKMYNIQEDLVYARTGKSMFGRRGGLEYIKREYKMQKNMKELKFISNFEFCKNIIARSVIRLIPNSLREIIYLKVLRG
ncbi:glycosyltransferase [uncultured Clostridium sp.]|uniref:glycosyltransferase n=1 Tax=uncultured Clostridium sp. TaxID=59620 RepID=UPI002635CD15|nr:glycosyltransferase [uncultured Clostridium sp.]